MRVRTFAPRSQIRTQCAYLRLVANSTHDDRIPATAHMRGARSSPAQIQEPRLLCRTGRHDVWRPVRGTRLAQARPGQCMRLVRPLDRKLYLSEREPVTDRPHGTHASRGTSATTLHELKLPSCTPPGYSIVCIEADMYVWFVTLYIGHRPAAMSSASASNAARTAPMQRLAVFLGVHFRADSLLYKL